MRKRVYGKAEVVVYVEVEVPDGASTDDIIDAAYKKRMSLTGYCGNGGNNKLCGVSGRDEGLDGDMEIEWAPNPKDDIHDI